ncbi:hypothetical protein RJ035_003503 [Blastomyces gilchristii]
MQPQNRKRLRSDSTQKYCQFATFRKESQPESGYTRGICTSNPPESDLRIHLLVANSEAIVSQPREDDRAYQLRIRGMPHRLSKRASALSDRNAGIVGGLVAFWVIILLTLCICVASRKNRDPPAAPAAAASAQNNTTVYVMGPPPGQPGQPQDPNVQHPPLAYILPAGSAQASAGHPQTIYIQGPPPPGAQPIQFMPAPRPIPEPHPSYTQPPPAYQK